MLVYSCMPSSCTVMHRAVQLGEHDAGAPTWHTLASHARGLRSLTLHTCDVRDTAGLCELPHLTQLRLCQCDVRSLDVLPPSLCDLTLSSLSGCALQVGILAMPFVWWHDEPLALYARTMLALHLHAVARVDAFMLWWCGHGLNTQPTQSV